MHCGKLTPALAATTDAAADRDGTPTSMTNLLTTTTTPSSDNYDDVENDNYYHHCEENDDDMENNNEDDENGEHIREEHRGQGNAAGAIKLK